MNKLIVCILLFIIGCSSGPEAGSSFKYSLCTVTQTNLGSIITCPDGSSTTVLNGNTGSTGSTGQDGSNGTNGTNGSNGTNGIDGTNGTSVTYAITPDTTNCPNGGYDLTLTDSTHTTVNYLCNGTNGINGTSGQAGTNGQNGTNGGTITFDLVQAIEPCGAASSSWKEVLLGLQGGQLLSSFSETMSGSNTRFSFIPNGSYIDTDESGCNFTVTGDGSTWSTISWSAGSNSYNPVGWSDGGYNWTSALGWVSF
jgi:hypothetical protein